MIKTAADILKEIGNTERTVRKKHDYPKNRRSPVKVTPDKCTLPRCDIAWFCGDYCRPHYRRWLRWGTPYGGRAPRVSVKVIGPI